MAHFAKLDSNNVVLDVLTCADENAPTEAAGIAYLQSVHGWSNWKQTSYNTEGGVHKLGGTPFRKNYAYIGGTYDASRDAFIQEKPEGHDSWVLNETTCQWEAPVAHPESGGPYMWDESQKAWVVNPDLT